MRNFITWSLTLICVFLVCATALAQDNRAPIVFITIDTSGSMNFTVDGTQMYDAKVGGNSTSLCKSSTVGASGDPKSRLMLAKEALAGSVKNYTTCASGVNGYHNAYRGYCQNQTIYRSYNVCDATQCYNNKVSMKYGDIYMTFTGTNSIPLVCPYFSDLDASDDKFYGDGLIQSYASSVKFGFAGYAYYASDNNLYGRVSSYTDNGISYNSPMINDSYKTMYAATGIWTAKSSLPAPLMYPSAFDDVSEIERANARVVDMVRSYYAYGGTPTGPALADLLYVFTKDENNYMSPINSYEKHIDPYYSCRDKAIIVVTDGEPSAGYSSSNANTKGHISNVWYDARHLFDAGIKTYVVGYAFSGLNTSARSMLNKTAWQGGTCRLSAGSNEVIHPTDTTRFNTFQAEGKNCFYDAASGEGLRIALVSVLTDMLRGKVSKTKAATTNRIGRIANGSNTGWYEVYSGYEVGQSNLWTPHLERETFVCSDAGFVRDESQFIDMAKILADRVGSCKQNQSCLSERNIWVGDYESTKQHAIKPSTLPLSDSKAGHVGSSAYFDYHESKSACNTALNQSIYTTSASGTQTPVLNYMLNPYICATDFDCESASRGRYCTSGKCLSESALTGYKRCSQGCTASEVCYANFCYPKQSQCTTHAACGTGKVCHLGRCEPGVVRNCEYRSFIASQPLGTIEYANPLVVGGPERNLASTSYQVFSKKYWLRDTMLYAGANDGMLHAFVLGKHLNPANSTAEGGEKWAFIPKTLYGSMRKLLNFGKQSFVNASPVSRDIFMPSLNQWRTVLVGGFRDGGRGYYALDITDPAAPSVIWEINNTYNPQNKPDGSEPFARLGYSYSEPLITVLNINGTLQPVAILSGGLPQPGSYAENGDIGKALYILKLDPNADGSDLLVATINADKVLTGAPAGFPHGFNKVAQLVYVGDATGRMHRIDLSNSNPSQWITLANAANSVIFDPLASGSGLINQAYEPIFQKPAVGSLANNFLSVSFGTGMPDNISIYGLKNNYFASFVDKRSCTTSIVSGVSTQTCTHTVNPSGSYFPKLLAFDSNNDDSLNVLQTGTTISNATSSYTLYHVQSGQKITASPLLYNYQVYVPSYQSRQSADSCAIGNAKVWRISVSEDGTRAGANNVSSSITVQRPDSQDDYWKNNRNPNYFALGSNTVVYGLEVSPQNICIQSTDSTGAMTASLAAPQLILQTGTNPHKDATGIPGPNANSSPNRTTESIAIDLAPVLPKLTPLSWSSVYE